MRIGLAPIGLFGMGVRASLLSVLEISWDRLLHISTHPSALPGLPCTCCPHMVARESCISMLLQLPSRPHLGAIALAWHQVTHACTVAEPTIECSL